MKQARASFNAPNGGGGQCGFSAVRSNLLRLGLLLVIAMIMAFAFIGNLRAQQQSGLLPAACKKEFQNLIVNASAKHDFAQMLRLLKQYRNDQCPYFADLDYYEAFAAFNTGDRKRAKTAVERYMRDPGEKQYTQQAEAMHLQIIQEDDEQAQREMHIEWDKSEPEKATIRTGRAQVAGQSVEIKGLTLRCHVWNGYNRTYEEKKAFFGSGPKNQMLLEGRDLTFERGENIAHLLFHYDTLVLSLHYMAPTDVDPSASHRRAPWEAYYTWGVENNGFWKSYAKRDSESLALWDWDYLPGRLEVWSDSEHTFGGYGPELHFNDGFTVNISSMTVVQTLEPHILGGAGLGKNYCESSEIARSGCAELLRGINSVLNSHHEDCHRIRYREPPDPE